MRTIRLSLSNYELIEIDLDQIESIMTDGHRILFCTKSGNRWTLGEGNFEEIVSLWKGEARESL